MIRSDLEKLTLKKLKIIAKNDGAKGYSSLKKNDLINKLLVNKLMQQPLKDDSAASDASDGEGSDMEVILCEPEVVLSEPEKVPKINYNTNKFLKHFKLFKKANPSVIGKHEQLKQAKKTYNK